MIWMIKMNLCNICLSEKVKGEVDKLTLCGDCLKKVEKYWNESEVKRY